MRLVEVEWLDSVSTQAWTNTEEFRRESTRDEMLHRTAGYLVEANDDMVTVAGSRSETGNSISDVMQIPRVAVLTIRHLKRNGNDGS